MDNVRALALAPRQMVDVTATLDNFDLLARVNAISIGLVVVSFATRLLARIKMLHLFGREDWAMVVTMALYITQSSLLFVTCSMGKQLTMGRLDLQPGYTKLNQVGNGIYALVMIALKFSLGFFFLRILSHRKAYRYAVYVIFVFSTLTGLTYWALSTFTCAQIKDVQAIDGACAVQTATTDVFTTFSVVTITSDFVLAIMAVAALWRAKLPLPTKLVAGLLLALGTVGGVASTIRLVLILQPTDPQDYLEQLFASGRWVVIEIATGIIAANLAMIRPILHKMLEKMRIISTVRTTKMGADEGYAGNGYVVSASGGRRTTGQRSQRDRDWDEIPLNDVNVRKDVLVTVDEEIGRSERWEHGPKGIGYGRMT
ncbi:Glycogenin-1 [Sphaceloma murrayae]|uniref:Glycogenin-1 n=1 Tax=Sphaceloma murrayae TaxID=2082308 RepID=A0A2K1QT67_9PEZI|nr:Glycogenin-1 [Sphaceloma murrayae]